MHAIHGVVAAESCCSLFSNRVAFMLRVTITEHNYNDVKYVLTVTRKTNTIIKHFFFFRYVKLVTEQFGN